MKTIFTFISILIILISFNACRKETDHTKIIYIPDMFTPNNDGVNDYFSPKGFALDSMIKFKARILNENNELVFSSEKTYVWDGKDRNGNFCITGNYFYSFWFHFSDQTKERFTGVVRLN
ncbi:MAG: gliding motility-associated C-terminal domain-containing protein [Bacteroidota bacterium]